MLFFKSKHHPPSVAGAPPHESQFTFKSYCELRRQIFNRKDGVIAEAALVTLDQILCKPNSQPRASRLERVLRNDLFWLATRSRHGGVWPLAATIAHREFPSGFLARLDEILKPTSFHRETTRCRALQLVGRVCKDDLRPLAATILQEQVSTTRSVAIVAANDKRNNYSMRASALVESISALGKREGAKLRVRCLGRANRILSQVARYVSKDVNDKGALIGEMYAAVEKWPQRALLRRDIVNLAGQLEDELLVPLIADALFFPGGDRRAHLVRKAAIKTLEQYASQVKEDEIQKIAEGLAHHDVEQRRVCAHALKSLGESARPVLSAVLATLDNESDERVLIPLLTVLHAVRSPDSHLALVTASKRATSPLVRNHAAGLLEATTRPVSQ